MTRGLSGQLPWRRYWRTIAVPQPAAGADWTITCPGSELWEIESVYAQLATSIAAANRTPRLTVGDGNTTWFDMTNALTQAASLTTRWLWAQTGVNSSVNNGRLVGLPQLHVEPGAVLASVTDNLDAGDQWSGVYVRVLATVFLDGSADISSPPPMTVIVLDPSAS